MIEQTVIDYISEGSNIGYLNQLSGRSFYWRKCEEFVNRNLDKKLGELSPKQLQWLLRIKSALIDDAVK